MSMQWQYLFKLRSKNSGGTVQHTFYPTFPPTRVGPPTYEPVSIENELLNYDIEQYLRGVRARLAASFEQVAGHIAGVPSNLETVLADKAAVSTNYLEACLNDNLLTYPSDFTNAAWTKNTLTVANASEADPTGATSSVSTLTPTGGATDCYALQQPTPVTIAAGIPYIFSIYIKAAAGTPAVNIDIRNQANVVRATLSCTLSSSAWTRFSVAALMVAGDTSVRVVIGANTSWPEADGALKLWGAQLHEGTVLLPYIAAPDWKRVNLAGDGYAPTMPGGKRTALGVDLELVARSLQLTVPSPDSGTW